MPTVFWWPNWYTTCSRLFAHYPSTNKCGNDPNKCKQQQTLLQLSIKDRPFVLVIIISVLLKTQVCQIHKQKISRAARQTFKKKKKGRLRIMDLWIIMAALFLLSYISTGSLQYSTLIFNWVWIELATRWLFMAWLHPAVPVLYEPI